MPNQQRGFFRLLDLPGEIRNDIYREVLCCFDPPAPPSSETDIKNRGVASVTHSIDTSILCTCRQVHREAYDVMVKTNQFIKVTSIDIDLARLILDSRLPVVTMDRATTNEFQGCVMSVDLSLIPGDWVVVSHGEDRDWDDFFDEEIHPRPTGTGPLFNFLMLWRDWSIFCQMLNMGPAFFKGFDTNVKIRIKMNNYPKRLPDYKAPIIDYFTVERQAKLLGNFGTDLRNFRYVFVGGTIDKQLALATMHAVAGRRWTRPEDVIRELQVRQNASKTATRHGSIRMYMDSVKLMRCICGSADYSRLIKDGSVPFVTSFAELYFNILLDACHPILETLRTTVELDRIQSLSDTIHEYLSLAQASLDDFAEEGSTFQPTSALLGKLCYSIAVCSRLLGQALPQSRLHSIVQCYRQAVDAIEAARQLNPTDAETLAENDRIAGWRPSILRQA